MFNKLITVGVLVLSSVAFASDHIDGVPSLELHEQVDLTDLYAFKTPEKKNNLTVILNMYPGVAEDGHFSSKVQYDLVFKAASLAGAPSLQTFIVQDESEVRVNCSFTDPGHHHHSSNAKSTVTCAVLQGEKQVDVIKANVGVEASTANNSLKIYTGPRSDAFFITRGHFESVTGREGFKAAAGVAGSNLMERINVLSIALEMNLEDLFPEDQEEYLTVSAESFTTYEGYKRILDRVGRPEITNLTLHDITEGDAPVKRSYNQRSLDGLRDSKDFSIFKNRLTENIGAYDKLDEEPNWSSEDLSAFTELLMDDYLVVNMSEGCIGSSNGYLQLERSILLGSIYNYCGGRKITDDIMNTLYTLYIGGLEGSLDDYNTGVSVPYQSSLKTLDVSFPYLVTPESTGIFTVNPTRFLLNGYIKRNQAE